MIKLKKLLKEGSPGFTKRKFGDPLPTFKDVMEKHQTVDKETINEVRWPDTQTARLLSQAFKDARVKVQKVWEKGNHEYIIRVRAKDGWTNVRMELNVISNVIMLDTQSGHVRLGELQPGSRGRKLKKNLKMLSKIPSFGVAGFKGLKYKIESITEASDKTGWKLYKVYDISDKLWMAMKYDLRDQFGELVKIGADYGVFQNAQGTAKILKQIKRLMDKIS